jgi:predicted RNase H-like HicB family nuclease
MAKTTLKRLMKQPRYRVTFTKAPEGGYSVWCPDLPGCNSQGETKAEARANIRDAIREWLAAQAELRRGEDTPKV